MTIHPALVPLANRWTTFLGKVKARVTEIEGEAKAAYAEVIAVDVVDGTGMSGVSSALKSRLLALRQKVDDSWNTIDAEADKLDLDDGRATGTWRGQMLALRAAFTRELDRETERIILQGEADAARGLQAAAQAEMATAVPCQHCGASIDRRGTPWHQAVNLTCPHCKAVTTATPGTAAQMFTQGLGAISLAREAAWPQWLAMQDAEAAWHKLRHKTLDDLMRWEAANRTYWQAYADAMGRLHPGWTAQHVANEVTGKMSQFMEYTAKDDRTTREINQAGVSAVASGDPARLAQWLAAQRDPGDAAEMLIEASIERGWTQHAPWIAQVAAPIAQKDAEWIKETVDDAMHYFATRGD
jgi:hypothetical protein